jgi:hypothetical protein
MKNYYIKQGDSFVGPFKNWQVLEKYEKGEINDDTVFRYGDWDTPKKIKRRMGSLKNLKTFLDAPGGVHNLEIIGLLENLQKETEKVKWACRSVALFLAVVVFFGAKITFNF